MQEFTASGHTSGWQQTCLEVSWAAWNSLGTAWGQPPIQRKGNSWPESHGHCGLSSCPPLTPQAACWKWGWYAQGWAKLPGFHTGPSLLPPARCCPPQATCSCSGGGGAIALPFLQFLYFSSHYCLHRSLLKHPGAALAENGPDQLPRHHYPHTHPLLCSL